MKFIHVTRLDETIRGDASINTVHIVMVEGSKHGEHFSWITLVDGTRMHVAGAPELILGQISGEVEL
jgi:hypothetical protein